MGTARKLQAGATLPKKYDITPRFTLEGREYAFRAPVHVAIDHEDGVFIECPDYKIYGQGKTLQAAELELAFVFSTLYKQYALEDDSRLTGDAQQLKRRLLEEVGSG
ncbi:hypothetical protein LBMAG21_03450 [Armatimonadota bacterium]|nr:hypothetical protein LBMAG21_03450 [Armatimonadota bacterium]